jgi:hypothetical protein
MLLFQPGHDAVDETGRPPLHREGRERDVERGAPAEPVNKTGGGVVIPVEVDSEVDAVPRFQEDAG